MPLDWVNGKQVGGPIKLRAATGTPDPTLQPGPLELSPSAVAVQPDGKAVFSGTRERCAYIARLNPDGSLDPTFQVFELSMSPRFLTVLPILTGQAADVLAREGQPVSFQVTAGPAGVGYQWSFNGQPLAGATSATLALPAVTPAQAGLYRVRITTPGGALVDSRDALLEVTEPDETNLGALSAEKLADLFADDPAEAGAGRPGRQGFTSLSMGVPGTRFLNLIGSLSEPGDPVPCDVLVSASRWLRFRTATPGAVVGVATTDAAFDTVLAVFTNRFNPVLVACNDDLGIGLPNSQLAFPAVPGVDYLVMVAAKGGATGACGVVWEATAPDVTADANPLGLDATVLEDGHFTFRRVVPPGFYQLDRGATLDTLAPVQRLRVRSGLLDYRDPEPASGEARFYRFNLAQ